MDARQFDILTRRLRAGSTRRRALGSLLAVPFLVQAANEESVTAARRGKGVEAEHYHKRKSTYCLNGRTFKALRRKKKKLLAQGATFGRCTPCVPDTNSTTCLGKCGEVLNNCGAAVNCGGCPCVPEEKSITCDGKCAEVLNNCGTPVDCGKCPCVPITCGDQCGQIPNECGGTLDCPPCPPENEVINGGSFEICNPPLKCQPDCICSGNIGSNYLCGTFLETSCDFSTDCPVGQACKIVTAGQSGKCWRPCPSG